MKFNAEAYILAGGRSSRFGSNKAFASFNGTTMIQTVFSTLTQIFKNVVIVVKNSSQLNGTDLPYILDSYDCPGALAGVLSAISNSKSSKIFISSCDLPHLNSDVIKRMMVLASDEDVLIPRIGGFRQPLHAVYDRRMSFPCLTRESIPMLDPRVKPEDDRNIKPEDDKNIKPEDVITLPEFLERLNCRYLDEKDFADIAGFERSFYNVNTMEDYAKI